MEPDLKQRLVGAIVLTLLAVIFLPFIFSDHPVMLVEPEQGGIQTNDSEDFSSSLVPVAEQPEPVAAIESEQTLSNQNEVAPTTASEPEPAEDLMPIDDSIRPQVGELETAQDPEIEPIETVTVEQIADAESVTVTTAPATESSNEINTTLGATRAWVVQLASFNSQDNARKLNQQLIDKGFESFIEPLVDKDNNKVVYRVRVGPPQLDKSKVESTRQKIKQAMELDGILIEYP